MKNQLVIAVPKGNPKGITGLADLTKPGLKVALCAEQVPCGAAAKKALDAAGVKLTPVTLEQDVKAALSKVKLGEVDAALVYRTDAKAAAADVDGIEFPESARRDQRLPDRRAQGRPEQGRRAGVRRLRAVRQGQGRARPRPASRRRNRCPRPVDDAADRRGRAAAPARRPASRSRCSCRPRSGWRSWCCRWPGCWSAHPWRTLPQRLAEPGVLDRAAAVAADRHPRHAWSACCSAYRWPGCWPGSSSPAGGWSGRWSPCRWCCRRWSAAWRCCCVFGRRGLVGPWLDATFGITLPFTTAGVVVAEAFVAMPFLVIAVEGALRGADTRYEEAAATLGAGRWTTFRRVTLPLVAPGIAAGAVLCWARALGEFGATITFAGNFPGRTQTMPLAVYLALETDLDAAIVLSLILLAVSVAILASLRDRWMTSPMTDRRCVSDIRSRLSAC